MVQIAVLCQHGHTQSYDRTEILPCALQCAQDPGLLRHQYRPVSRWFMAARRIGRRKYFLCTASWSHCFVYRLCLVARWKDAVAAKYLKLSLYHDLTRGNSIPVLYKNQIESFRNSCYINSCGVFQNTLNNRPGLHVI